MSNLEFNGVFVEDMGVLTPGSLRLTDRSLSFKGDKGGKSVNVSSDDIENFKWQKLGNKHGVRVGLNDGGSHRFGGFKESDFDKIKQFGNSNWGKNMEQDDLVIKGWNYGAAEVKGKSIDFSWENKPIFEIPCSYVSQCNVNKTEATLEFNQNDNSQIALMEMRFHMPAEQEDEDTAEKMEEFKKAVLAYAGLEVESEQPIVLLSEILCTTPRGRYDIKVYPTSIALHGKTYDYKLPVKSINRLFLVPHKDGRRVYFVLSLNPPIRQGQTRYSYLVFEFGKDEEQDLELEWTDEQLEEAYGSNLTREMSGPLYESVSKLFKIICNLKITVPGKFIGNTGTPAINCSHKQNPGLLYPMEKGFLFIHKPPMYVRFEEISSVHFARSDGGTVTRTFDFEIDLKSGSSLMFNSVEKEENNKLFDYLNRKNIKIRNPQAASGRGGAQQDIDSSDDEIDPYKNKVRAEGRQRDESEDDDSTDEDYDLDKDIKKKQREKNSSEGSGSEPDDEYDSGSEEDSSGSAETEPEDEEDVKKRRKGEKKERPKKEKGEKKEKKAKRTKDPNEPKRPSSAYMLWFAANRLSLKSDGDSVADVAKKGGQAWRELDADSKKEWEAKAAKDKSRWEAEMKEYKKNGGGASSSSSAKPSKKKNAGPSPSKAKSKEYVSDSDDSEEEEPKKKEKKAPKEESESEMEESGAGSDGSDESD